MCLRAERSNYICKSVKNLEVLYREFKYNIFVGERAVHLSKSIKFGLYVYKIFRVKVHLKGLGSVNLVSDSLANNLSGVNDILR